MYVGHNHDDALLPHGYAHALIPFQEVKEVLEFLQ